MPDLLPHLFSALALLLSMITAWFTLFRRGTLRMVRPPLIGFLHDLPGGEPKLFLRALLYATGRRGQIVESMYVRIRRGESTQIFSVWSYVETGLLKVGSGLHVGEEGVAHNHHFLPPKDGTVFQFLPGEYGIDIYATLVNQRTPLLLSTLTLARSQEQASELDAQEKASVLYQWGPDSQRYHAHLDTVRYTDATSVSFG